MEEQLLRIITMLLMRFSPDQPVIITREEFTNSDPDVGVLMGHRDDDLLLMVMTTEQIAKLGQLIPETAHPDASEASQPPASPPPSDLH